MKKSRKVIRIGGVPEHFNLPWHLAIENGKFEQEGLKVSWREFPGGTGAMSKALRDDEVDIAILLTEGIVADIIKGNPSRIVGQYITSPLIWGVHVGADGPIKTEADLEGQRYAVSRMGSGSHLMSFVHALHKGWDPSKQQFVIVGGLEGSRSALAEGKADTLLWEKYTTKPLVDNGEFRRVAEVRTPWPCFVIVAHKKFIKNHLGKLEALLSVIHKECADFMDNEQAISLVAERYDQKPVDVRAWFRQTSWSTDHHFPGDVLEKVMEVLTEVKVIEKPVAPSRLCHRLLELAD